MSKRSSRLTFVFAAAIASLAPLHADPLTQYTITAIGQFSGNSLNNNGQVAANVTGAPGGLVWDPVTGIRTLAGAIDAVSINDLGQVAGSAGGYAASWDASGTLTTFGPQYSYGLRINNSGQVLVGSSTSPTAFRKTGDTLAQLGGNRLQGFDMNNLGAIAGAAEFQAVVWEAGSLTPTLLPGGGRAAQAINDNGQVAGVAETAPGVFRAVRWNRDSAGVYTQELLSALVPNNAYTVRNMNNNGAIVGEASRFEPSAGGRVFRQVLWHADGSVLDITAIAEAAGISNFSLRDINNNGWLLGIGVRDGTLQSFLFKPTVVPEPGFYLSLALGLGGLWFARRRRA